MLLSKRNRLALIAVWLIIDAVTVLIIAGCANRNSYQAALPPPTAAIPAISPKPAPQAKIVKASWYGPGLNGHRTATGERFNDDKLTAASTNLPLGSVVKVTNPVNGRSVRVRINDCGPYIHGRSMDLSKRAAEKIGITHKGVAHLRVTPVEVPRDAARCS